MNIPSLREAGKRLYQQIRPHRWLIAGLMAGAFLLGFSASFEPACSQVDGGEGHEKDCQHDNCVCPTALALGSDWIGRNKDTFEGVSTAFVALFTFTLWRATVLLWKAGEGQRKHAERSFRLQVTNIRASLKLAQDSAKAATKAADAADLSARAAVRVELPALQVGKIEISDQAFEANYDWPDNLFLNITINNYGRTPAFIINLSVNVWNEFEPLPPNPIYTLAAKETVYYPSKIIEPGGEKVFRDLKYYHTRVLSRAPWVITHTNTVLFVYGYVRFLDFLNDEHMSGFVFVWIPEQKVLAPMYGLSEYHYQT